MRGRLCAGDSSETPRMGGEKEDVSEIGTYYGLYISSPTLAKQQCFLVGGFANSVVVRTDIKGTFFPAAKGFIITSLSSEKNNLLILKLDAMHCNSWLGELHFYT